MFLLTRLRCTDEHSQSRGVNELLADLRRTGLSNRPAVQRPIEIAPTLPPVIRTLLQLPETPSLRPRRPERRYAAQAGPPPPRSWLSAASHAANICKAQQYGGPENREYRPLPGVYSPAEGSLIDVVLKRFAYDWEFQKSYCRYCFYDLPTHLRTALLSYLAMWHAEGVSLADLRAIFLPPEDDPEYVPGRLSPSEANEFVRYLDLTGSLGRSLKLRELSAFLFPSRPKTADLQDSWDEPEESSAAIPRPLLPNLTHLSLGIRPGDSHGVSWRQLLAFAPHCHRLTHLSLAFWPEPSLTPNAKLATFVSPEGRSVGVSGTGPYSRKSPCSSCAGSPADTFSDSLDNDWSEAIMVLRRLSKSLYELEYLDLTGCGEWSEAPLSSSGHDSVDWVGDWGKITRVLLHPGYRLADDAGVAETAKYRDLVQRAERVERHITAKRAGRGRFITVETVAGMDRDLVK